MILVEHCSGAEEVSGLKSFSGFSGLLLLLLK